MRNKRLWIIFLVVLLQRSIAFAQDSGNVLANLKGQIAYIGVDENVYSIDLASSQRRQLTEDAIHSQEVLRYYQLPTWSTDGRLAYFEASLAANNKPQLTVYVSLDGASAGKPVYSSENELVVYAYWSPQDCTVGEHCRDLAILLQGIDPQFTVRLIRDSQQNPSSQSVGKGNPFYYSWSPDGTHMLWQRSLQTLDVYDVNAQGISRTLPQQPGMFQAPAWSPVDDRMLLGARNSDGRSTDLVIMSDESTETLATGLMGSVAFAWSPDGSRVAFIDHKGNLAVLDAATGKTIARGATAGILAFFWSPNSDRIAYVTSSFSPGALTAKNGAANSSLVSYQQQQTPQLMWSVLNVNTGATNRYGSFQPTDDMVFLLSFFDQFAQSHRVWSPDGGYLVYSEITADNQSAVSILDTTQPDTIPVTVADGRIGIWSFS